MGEDHRGNVHPLLLLTPKAPQFREALGEPQRPHTAEGEMTKAVGAFVLDDAMIIAGVERGPGVGPEDGGEADPCRLLDLLDAEWLGEHSLRPDGKIVDDESLDHPALAATEVALEEADHRLELVENELCLAIGDVREKGKVARADRPRFRFRLVGENWMSRGRRGLGRGWLLGRRRRGDRPRKRGKKEGDWEQAHR